MPKDEWANEKKDLENKDARTFAYTAKHLLVSASRAYACYPKRGTNAQPPSGSRSIISDSLLSVTYCSERITG